MLVCETVLNHKTLFMTYVHVVTHLLRNNVPASTIHSLPAENSTSFTDNDVITKNVLRLCSFFFFLSDKLYFDFFFKKRKKRRCTISLFPVVCRMFFLFVFFLLRVEQSEIFLLRLLIKQPLEIHDFLFR